MSPAVPAKDSSSDEYREAVLRQLRLLTEENQRLVRSAARSEKRFRTLAKAVWRIQEEERRRLARELHDGIGQALTALVNQLQRISNDAQAHSNLGLASRMADALEITRGALHDTRELSRLLRPTLLDDLGLEPALGWLARTLSERTGLAVDLRSTLGEQRLPSDVETLVFRITQEALTNVIRHSGAASARVTVSMLAGLLRLQIRDDGHGADMQVVAEAERNGISSGVRGMRDRAELFGGRLDFRSAPGEGTTVQLTLSLQAAEEATLKAGGV